MANARVKRLFDGAASDPSQRHITNFFDQANRTKNGSSSDDNDNDDDGDGDVSMMPSLPDSVQANLLSVGMRVRKSVPEGYKTGKAAREDQSMMTPSPPAAGQFMPTGPFSTSLAGAGAAPAASYASSQRELLPFCGIHKVGGLSVQTFHDSEDNERPLFAPSLFLEETTQQRDRDEPPSLTSSQSTVSSTASSTASSTTTPKFDPASAYITPPRSSIRSDLASTPSPVFFSAGRLGAGVANRKRARDTQDVASDDEDHDQGDDRRDDGDDTTRIDDPFAPTVRGGVHKNSASALGRPYGKGTTAMTSWMGQKGEGGDRVQTDHTRHDNNAPIGRAPTSPLAAYYQAGRRVLAVPRRRQPPQQQSSQPAAAAAAAAAAPWLFQPSQQPQHRTASWSYPSPPPSLGQASSTAPETMSFKPRMVQNSGGGGVVVHVLDQENVGVRSGGGDDFAEANFLDASLYYGTTAAVATTDRDQEMGGM